MSFQDVVELIGEVIELVGIAVLLVGIVVALMGYVAALAKGDAGQGFLDTRRSIGRSILLGLEILVAGDIVRTVALSPTFTSVGVLGGVVLIRTFLSFVLELEISGSWPWSQGPEPID